MFYMHCFPLLTCQSCNTECGNGHLASFVTSACPKQGSSLHEAERCSCFRQWVGRVHLFCPSSFSCFSKEEEVQRRGLHSKSQLSSPPCFLFHSMSLFLFKEEWQRQQLKPCQERMAFGLLPQLLGDVRLSLIPKHSQWCQILTFCHNTLELKKEAKGHRIKWTLAHGKIQLTQCFVPCNCESLPQKTSW